MEEAQDMAMPESQKFGILRVLMAHEERVHVKNVVGIASYNKENFNFTIKKIREEWDALPANKKNVQMAAATESATTDRICFKFQTNECTRKGCPYIHRIMPLTRERQVKLGAGQGNHLPAIRTDIARNKCLY